MTLASLDPRNWRQRDIAIGIIVLSVLLGVLWYFYMYRPAQEEIAQLEVTIEGLNADIRRGEIARDSIEALEADIARLKVERDEFLAELPRESEVSGLIDQLRLGATAAGVEFNSVSQGGGANEGVQDVRPIGFSVATQGNYGQTMGFLDILESLRRFTKIQQVGLSVNEDNQDDPPLSANYNFTVYVYTGSDAGDIEQ